MNEAEAIAAIQEGTKSLMRAEERIMELEAQVADLIKVKTMLSEMLTKARQTIRRMEEGEL